MREENLKKYDAIIAQIPGIERKGKTMPYTSDNGYMFSLVNKAGEVGIRLPKDRQKEFTEKFNSGPYFSYGAKMRDYVIIPEDVLNDVKHMISLFEESQAFVKSLPPK